MSYVGPTVHLPDGTPIPPIRRRFVCVPWPNGTPVYCWVLVLDQQEKLAQIEIEPWDGSFSVGDIIEYAWLPDSEIPVVTAWRGQL